MKNIFTLSILMLFFFSCQTKNQHNATNLIISENSNDTIFQQTTSIRGLDVVNKQTVWLSGTKGFYARSSNACESWITGTIANDTLVDFRDIHAFDDQTALVLSAGSPAKIYKTNDGGTNWKLVYFLVNG